MSIDVSSRSRLSPGAKKNFPSESLFDRIARVVCDAHCLPRKELFESWEVARRVRRRFRGGRVVDLACGHGLIAHLMLILDNSSATAVAVDERLPKSAPILSSALTRAWPRIDGRVELRQESLENLPLTSTDIVVCAHGCGTLTDRVIERAIASRARLALLPCCHDANTCDTGGMEGWLDASLAIDVARVHRLQQAGYRVSTHTIPRDITEKNRLLIADPFATDAASTF